VLAPRPAYALLGLGSATPNQGTTAGGTVVDIVGLDPILGSITGIEFGGVPATNVQLVDLLTLRATAPAHAAGLVDIKLRITLNVLGIPLDQVFTLTNGYTYVLPPTATTVAPNSGPSIGGTIVVVTGTNFRSGMTVKFGPNFATGVIINSTTQMTVTTPAGPVGAVDVAVVNPEGEAATLTGAYTYVGPAVVSPTITSVAPTHGPQSGGTPIVIHGTGFQPGALLTICGQSVAISNLTAITISATTPGCAPGAVTITVTNPDGGTASASGVFTSDATSTPTIDSIAPLSGSPSGGTPVVITGTGFLPGATVTIGCAAATGVLVVNATTISAIAPACPNGSTGDVIVVNPDGGTATLGGGFTFGVSAPTLTGISPGTGPVSGGTPVTMAGSNFAHNATLTFGGVPATSVVVINTHTLTAITPAHAAGVVNIVLTNPDGGTATLGSGFTYAGGGGPVDPNDTDGDGLSNACEIKFGLDPNSAVSPNGANDDPDGDGLTNQQECDGGTHPRGFFKRYLAEGATGTFFDTEIALLNAGTTNAITLLEYQTLHGTTPTDYLIVPSDHRRTVNPELNPALAAESFATVIESDQPLTIERTMKWDATHYGSHSETAAPAPQTVWYLAEGATPAPLNMFYLILNPGTADAHITVTYYRPQPRPPIVKNYTFGAHSRGNIWVDAEGPEFVAEEFSAKVESDVPIMVERVMYADTPGKTWAAGTAAAGIHELSSTWFFAEGASSSFFNTFILIQNPNAAPVTVRATYLLDTGEVRSKDYPVMANSRFNISANSDSIGLLGHSFSTRLETLGGEGILAERAMWWPSGGPWTEGHASAGVTSTGTEFLVAGGEQGGADHAKTYVLVANVSTFAASLRVRAIADDDTVIERFFAVPKNSRFNVDVAALFPEMVDKKFGLLIESIGASPAQITAEVSVYLSADGEFWSAGSNAQATRVR
jgi:hypothetical protein